MVLNKCGMLSYQDTWLTSKTINNRQYSKNCFIEGAVDFIYGQGNIYFDSDTLNIVRKSGGYIVAPNHSPGTTWGYVFQNTLITAPGVPSETDVWLGRPWHEEPMTVFINTKAEVTIPAAGWYDHMGGLPKIWAEYNTVDGNGNVVHLSHRNTMYWKIDETTGEKVWGEAKAVLTAEEAAQYTIKNVLGGTDNWQPELITEPCDAPVVTLSGSSLTWQSVPYAICYVVTHNGEVVGFTTDCKYDIEGDGVYGVQAVNEYGGLSAMSVQTVATTIQDIEASGEITAIYDANGVRQPSYVKGLNVVRLSNGRYVKMIK